MPPNQHLLLAGSTSGSHTACAASIVARSRNAESLDRPMTMNLRRHLAVPDWNDAAAQVAVEYWRTRGFETRLDVGPSLIGTRGSEEGSWKPFVGETKGVGNAFDYVRVDIDWRKFHTTLLMGPQETGVVSVDLEIFRGTRGWRWTEWGTAYWRLEIVELHHLLNGMTSLEEIWDRFNPAVEKALRIWVWTQRLFGTQMSEAWEDEISDLEVQLMLTSKGSA